MCNTLYLSFVQVCINSHGENIKHCFSISQVHTCMPNMWFLLFSSSFVDVFRHIFASNKALQDKMNTAMSKTYSCCFQRKEIQKQWLWCFFQGLQCRMTFSKKIKNEVAVACRLKKREPEFWKCCLALNSEHSPYIWMAITGKSLTIEIVLIWVITCFR